MHPYSVVNIDSGQIDTSLIMMRVRLLSAMASRLTDKDYVNQFCHRGQHHQQNLAQLIEDKLSASATEAQQDQALI